MDIFETIESAFSSMVNDMITSPDLCKLLYYDVSNPLSQIAVVNPQQMIFTGKDDQQEESYHRIFLTPKIPTVTDKKKTIIMPKILEINPVQDNIHYADFLIVFDIFTHMSLWSIEKNGIRIFKIMSKLNALYNLKHKSYGIGRGILQKVPYFTPVEKWGAYRLAFRFTDFSKKLD